MLTLSYLIASAAFGTQAFTRRRQHAFIPEFDNAEGEEFPAEFSAQGSPAAQNGPEVYVLPLTEVSLPMSKQPGRSGLLLSCHHLKNPPFNTGDDWEPQQDLQQLNTDQFNLSNLPDRPYSQHFEDLYSK